MGGRFLKDLIKMLVLKRMAAAAAAAPNVLTPCIISRYECPKDAEKIKVFAAAAELQMQKYANFKNIFPWRSYSPDCATTEHPSIHFIASTRIDNKRFICGWLAGTIKETEFGKQAYISQITTRRLKDPPLGRVGQALHQEFKKEAIRKGADFMLLYPLSDEVAAIYSKPTWGYTRTPYSPHMYQILPGKSRPSDAFFKSLISEPEHELDELDSLMEIYGGDEDGFFDEYLRVRNAIELNTLKGDTVFRDRLLQIFDDTEEDEERKTAAREIFEEISKKEGGRRRQKRKKTRRSKRKRQTKKLRYSHS
jgi:hypothetical protein